MLLPQWRSNSTATFSATTAWTVGVPSGVVAGDLVLAAFVGGSTDTLSAPDGSWTALTAATYTTHRLFVFWKIATASEGSTYAFTMGANATGGGQAHAFSNVDNGNPIAASGANVGSTSTCSTPSITPATTDDMLVALFASRTSPAGSMTQASGMTERSDVAYGTSRLLAVDTEQLVSSAATGTRSATVTNFSTNCCGYAVALRAAPAVPNFFFGGF